MSNRRTLKSLRSSWLRSRMVLLSCLATQRVDRNERRSWKQSSKKTLQLRSLVWSPSSLLYLLSFEYSTRPLRKVSFRSMRMIECSWTEPLLCVRNATCTSLKAHSTAALIFIRLKRKDCLGQRSYFQRTQLLWRRRREGKRRHPSASCRDPTHKCKFDPQKRTSWTKQTSLLIEDAHRPIKTYQACSPLRSQPCSTGFPPSIDELRASRHYLKSGWIKLQKRMTSDL